MLVLLLALRREATFLSVAMAAPKAVLEQATAQVFHLSQLATISRLGDPSSEGHSQPTCKLRLP
jgi:hypothetical protein